MSSLPRSTPVSEKTEAMTEVPGLAEIEAAARRLAGRAVVTPLLEQPALNERLGTTSHQAAAYQEWDYHWEEFGYNRKDVHDDRVTFFITRLAPGRHVLRYLARAFTGGDFAALPAQVYLMYQPDVWSRSAGSRLQITAR